MATIGRRRNASAMTAAKTNATAKSVWRTLLPLSRGGSDPRQETSRDELRLSGLAQDSADERARVGLVAARRHDADAVTDVRLCPPRKPDRRDASRNGLGIG